MTISIKSPQEFEELVLSSPVPVVVDFWAEWCGPCRMLAPVLEEAAQELGATATIVKINIDENPELASQYGVRSIPTLMLFKQGETLDTRIGNMAKSKIVEWVKGEL